MLAVQVETDPDTVIVTIDDDTYYHQVGALHTPHAGSTSWH